MDEFDAENLSKMAWSFVKADHVDVQLFEALARVAKRRVCEFKGQQLSHVQEAFEKMGQRAQQSSGNFTAAKRSNTAWAQLLTSLTKVAEQQRSDDFNAKAAKPSFLQLGLPKR